MECTNETRAWQAEIRRRLVIEPTVNAMQRHLLFTLRSASVQSSEPAPGTFYTIVEWEEASWEGAGESAAEAMGQVLLAMTRPSPATADHDPAAKGRDNCRVRR